MGGLCFTISASPVEDKVSRANASPFAPAETQVAAMRNTKIDAALRNPDPSHLENTDSDVRNARDVVVDLLKEQEQMPTETAELVNATVNNSLGHVDGGEWAPTPRGERDAVKQKFADAAGVAIDVNADGLEGQLQIAANEVVEQEQNLVANNTEVTETAERYENSKLVRRQAAQALREAEEAETEAKKANMNADEQKKQTEKCLDAAMQVRNQTAAAVKKGDILKNYFWFLYNHERSA